MDVIDIDRDNENEIKKWLYQRGLKFDKKVYVSWSSSSGLITKWKFVVKYWSSLFYESSDDLTIFDESLDWAILFFHSGEVYFGTNKKYEPIVEFKDEWFSN
jgi:hypothetical protein